MTCRLEAFEVQGLEQALLERGESAVADDGARFAARVAIDERDFLDALEGFEDPHDAQLDAFLGQDPAEQGAEEQGQDAVESVDPNLLTGPLMQRAPAASSLHAAWSVNKMFLPRSVRCRRLQAV